MRNIPDEIQEFGKKLIAASFGIFCKNIPKEIEKNSPSWYNSDQLKCSEAILLGKSITPEEYMSDIIHKMKYLNNVEELMEYLCVSWECMSDDWKDIANYLSPENPEKTEKDLNYKNAKDKCPLNPQTNILV